MNFCLLYFNGPVRFVRKFVSETCSKKLLGQGVHKFVTIWIRSIHGIETSWKYIEFAYISNVICITHSRIARYKGFSAFRGRWCEAHHDVSNIGSSWWDTSFETSPKSGGGGSITELIETARLTFWRALLFSSSCVLALRRDSCTTSMSFSSCCIFFCRLWTSSSA